MSVRVRMIRGSWTVLVQSPKVKNASGRLFRAIGSTDEDRVEAERIAESMGRMYGRVDFNPLAPLPVDQVLEDWLLTYGATLKHSTEQTDSGLVRNHLVPFFGSKDLREVRRADLLRFATEKAAEGRSVALVKNALSLFRRVVNLVMEDRPGLLERNPAARIGEHVAKLENRQAGEVRQVDSWTLEEARNLLELACRLEARIYPMVLFALHTGARRGEILGLQWPDLDLARGRAQIRRARVKGRTVTPKSGEGRFVALSPELRAELERLRAEGRRAAPWDDEGWVFSARKGRPRKAPKGTKAPSGRTAMQEVTFRRAWLRLKRNFAPKGIRPLTFHSCRHTFATLALEAGKSVKWVADMLGHADPSITLRVYAHALRTDEPDLSFLPRAAPASAEARKAPPALRAF